VDKKELRKEVLKRRKETKDRLEKSKVIQFEVMNHPLYQGSEVIAIYNSFGSEVSTKELIRMSIGTKSVVLIPKVVDKELIFIKVDENTEYQTSKFGIEEPVSNEEYRGPIDLVIVPGVAFTKEGKRLGYGGGYYDRFLKGKKIQTIGICFESQIVGTIPTEEHDIEVDYVQTEENIYKNNKNNENRIYK
jgi:5-formyltetrahydrofolate cyclo-ligase